MRFVSRSQWGARKPLRDYGDLDNPRGTTVHWEGPRMGTFTHDQCAAKVRGIQTFHMNTRGWNDIAYTALACPHGYVFEGRGIGHRSAANGTDLGNATHYAVCALVGEGDPIPDALLEGLDDAIVWLRTKGRAGRDVNAHRDHKPTHCPGDDLYEWAHQPHPVVTTEEDPLAQYTEKDLQEAAGTGVLGARIGRAEVAPGKPLTVGIVLDRLYNSAVAERARDQATAAAIQALSEARGVDPATVTAAVDAAVKAALNDLSITLTTKES